MKNKALFVKRLINTGLLLLLYFVCTKLPMPFIHQEVSSINNIWDMVASINGASSGVVTLLSLGLMPYFMSTLVMKLLSSGISPMITEMSKGTQSQRKTYAKLSLYIFYIIAFLQSFSYLVINNIDKNITGGLLSADGLLTAGLLFVGSLTAKFIADQISRKGLANGYVMIIAMMLVINVTNGLLKSISVSDNLQSVIVNMAVLIGLVIVSIFIQMIKITTPVSVDSLSGSATGKAKAEPLHDNLSVSIMCVGITPIVYYSLASPLIELLFPHNLIISVMVSFALIFIFTEIAIHSDFDANKLFNTFMFNGIYFNDMKNTEETSKKVLRRLFGNLAKANAIILCFFYSLNLIYNSLDFLRPLATSGISGIQILLFGFCVLEIFNTVRAYFVRNVSEILY